MADPVLKFPGEQAAPAAEAKRKPLSGRFNKTRRLILLVDHSARLPAWPALPSICPADAT